MMKDFVCKCPITPCNCKVGNIVKKTEKKREFFKQSNKNSTKGMRRSFGKGLKR